MHKCIMVCQYLGPNETNLAILGPMGIHVFTGFPDSNFPK